MTLERQDAVRQGRSTHSLLYARARGAGGGHDPGGPGGIAADGGGPSFHHPPLQLHTIIYPLLAKGTYLERLRGDDFTGWEYLETDEAAGLVEQHDAGRYFFAFGVRPIGAGDEADEEGIAVWVIGCGCHV